MRLGKSQIFSALVVLSFIVGCSTTPSTTDKEGFLVNSKALVAHYEKWVPGLTDQIDKSGGFVVFPDIARWGIIFGGGSFGRAAVCKPDGTQIGWAAINNGSVGLQAGVEGFKLLLILQNDQVLQALMKGQLTGSATGVLVVAQGGSSGAAKFTNGVAAYESAQEGLMAGVNIGLDFIRYDPLSKTDVPGKLR
jgi:lipid-binding SYLF domain-containing protein